MAKIPTFTARGTSPGQIRGANLRQVRQPDIGAAISDVGASLTTVVSGIARNKQATEQAFQRAEDSRSLNNEIANSSKNLSLFTQGLESNPDDFQNWSTSHEEYTKGVLEDAQARLNPAVFDAFKADYTKSTTRSFVNTINSARRVGVDKGNADLDSNLSIYSDLYSTSADPEDRRTVLGQASLAIADAQNTGIISEQKANQMRSSFIQSGEETRLENDLNTNPTVTHANFESGEYAISEESKPAFSNKIDTAVRAKESERIRVYEANEKKQKEALKLQQESLEIDFREKLLNDNLTDTEIIRAGQTRELNVSQVKSLLSDNNKADKTQSDPEEYDKTLKSILANELSTDQIMGNPDLSSQDKKTFTGMITTYRNREDTQKAKQLNEDSKDIGAAIRPFIITTGPLAQFVKSDEQILYQSAIQEMNDRLEAGEDKDKIKLDIIRRYSRVPVSSDQLPRLRFGVSTNIEQAKDILVQKLRSGQITAIEAQREAQLIQKHEEAIKNQEEITRLNNSVRNR